MLYRSTEFVGLVLTENNYCTTAAKQGLLCSKAFAMSHKSMAHFIFYLICCTFEFWYCRQIPKLRSSPGYYEGYLLQIIADGQTKGKTKNSRRVATTNNIVKTNFQDGSPSALSHEGLNKSHCIKPAFLNLAEEIRELQLSNKLEKVTLSYKLMFNKPQRLDYCAKLQPNKSCDPLAGCITPASDSQGYHPPPFPLGLIVLQTLHRKATLSISCRVMWTRCAAKKGAWITLNVEPSSALGEGIQIFF